MSLDIDTGILGEHSHVPLSRRGRVARKAIVDNNGARSSSEVAVELEHRARWTSVARGEEEHLVALDNGSLHVEGTIPVHGRSSIESTLVLVDDEPNPVRVVRVFVRHSTIDVNPDESNFGSNALTLEQSIRDLTQREVEPSLVDGVVSLLGVEILRLQLLPNNSSNATHRNTGFTTATASTAKRHSEEIGDEDGVGGRGQLAGVYLFLVNPLSYTARGTNLSVVEHPGALLQKKAACNIRGRL